MSLVDPKFLCYLGESTSDILSLFPADNEFDGLTAERKGFWYEIFVQSLLDANNCNYSGNATVFSDWKSNQIAGYDIKLRLPNGVIKRVECKFTRGHVYPSWVSRDWCSRDAEIYVTNNFHAVPYRQRRALETSGKKLLSTTQFIMYVQKMMKGNKYSYLISTNYNDNNTRTEETVTQQPSNIPIHEERRENLPDFPAKQTLPASHNTELRKTKLTCENCMKRKYCDVKMKLDALQETRPKGHCIQSSLEHFYDGPVISKSCKAKWKDWAIANASVNSELFTKQQKCLARRTYLHLNKKYRMFAD